MKMMRKIAAAAISAALLWTALPAALAEETEPAEETLQEAVGEAATETVAETAAETAAGETSQKLDASYALALNAINAEDYEAAKDYLEICFAYCDRESDPVMYSDLLLKRACIQVIEEKLDMALLTLDAALTVRPDLAEAYLVRTQIYTTQGQIDAAITNLEKYIELSGDTSLYETLAQLHEAVGNASDAEAAYDRYMEAVGEDVPEAGFQSGLYKMQAGKLEEAITAFEAFAQDETYGAGAMFNIGVCKMNLGDYNGAIEAFDASQAKGGTYQGLYYNRGICYLLSENWESAAADFTNSIESESYVADASYNLGLCQMQMEQYESAVATFTGLIGDGAKTEGPGAENSGEEGSETEQPSAQNEVSDAVYYYRGVCNAALGNLEAALADYTVCIDHGYELSMTYYQRAQVYAVLGDTENYNSDLENYLIRTDK